MNKRELKEIIEEEKKIYIRGGNHFQRYTHGRLYMIWRFLSYYRLTQFYREEQTKQSGFQKIAAKIKLRYYTRKKRLFRKMRNRDL